MRSAKSRGSINRTIGKYMKKNLRKSKISINNITRERN